MSTSRPKAFRSRRRIIARLSGDEFIIVVADKMAIARASQFAQEAISSLNQPFNLGGPQVTIGASIGITEFPKDGADYETILVNADLAMYAAKKNGRNSFAFYTAELAEHAKRRLHLESDLKIAVRNKNLTVHYQPQVECRSGRIRGVEALVRWNHPQFGFVSPGVFMPIAEEIGLVNEIDQFVIARSIQEIGALIQAGADFRLSANVTATEIEDPDSSEKLLRSSINPVTRRRGSRSKSPNRSRSKVRRRFPVASQNSGKWACASRSTISVPAIRIWQPSPACPSTP